MSSLPWTEAEWTEDDFQVFLQSIAKPVANTLDWSEIADDPLETMSSIDLANWTAEIASPTTPASSASSASIVKQRGLPYRPGIILDKPSRYSFATMAKHSRLPRKKGAIPLRSAMKYKGPYAPSGLRTTRSVQINPIESLGSTHTAKEYDRSYTGLGYSASLAQRRQKEQSKTKLPPLRFRY